MKLTVSSKMGNFYSAFLILTSINLVHSISEISVPVSKKISASLLHGPHVMEIIAVYCEGRVAHIHALCRRVRLLNIRTSGAYSRHCFFNCFESSCGPGSSVGIATDYGLDGPGIEFESACSC